MPQHFDFVQSYVLFGHKQFELGYEPSQQVKILQDGGVLHWQVVWFRGKASQQLVVGQKTAKL